MRAFTVHRVLRRHSIPKLTTLDVGTGQLVRKPTSAAAALRSVSVTSPELRKGATGF
jgi:hypothetical protein